MVVFAAIVVLCGKLRLSQPREEATSDDVLSKKGQANAVSSGWRAGNIKGYTPLQVLNAVPGKKGRPFLRDLLT